MVSNRTVRRRIRESDVNRWAFLLGRLVVDEKRYRLGHCMVSCGSWVKVWYQSQRTLLKTWTLGGDCQHWRSWPTSLTRLIYWMVSTLVAASWRLFQINVGQCHVSCPNTNYILAANISPPLYECDFLEVWVCTKVHWTCFVDPQFRVHDA